MNKYYLYKKVLTNSDCIAELETKSDIQTIFGLESEISIKEAYDDRVNMITNVTKTLLVNDITSVTGLEISEIMNQRDEIISALKKQKYAETLINNKHTFKEVLEMLFEVTLDHILNYEKAEQLLTGNRVVTVIVDGNNHDLKINGEIAIFKTEISNNIITLEKCNEIVTKLKNEFNYTPNQLKFLLSIYTKTEGNEFGDSPEECLLNKDVVYDVNRNEITEIND